MKTLTYLLLASLLTFCSCERKPVLTTQAQKHETPKPLQNDSKDISLISKRMPDENLVEAIYADMIKDNADLKGLEEQRQHFDDGHQDSLKEFYDYDRKSNNYYNSANETLNSITDTVLKQRLKMLVTSSQKKYVDRVAKIKSAIKNIDADELTTSNYYLTLKLAATLPVMEDYQADHMPNGKSITAIVNESVKLKHSTQKLAAKYEDKLTGK